jgi:hypothetical protein
VTRVPVGGAAAGGGSTSGAPHSSLLFLGVALLAGTVPALALRRRARARR